MLVKAIRTICECALTAYHPRGPTVSLDAYQVGRKRWEKHKNRRKQPIRKSDLLIWLVTLEPNCQPLSLRSVFAVPPARVSSVMEIVIPVFVPALKATHPESFRKPSSPRTELLLN